MSIPVQCSTPRKSYTGRICNSDLCKVRTSSGTRLRTKFCATKRPRLDNSVAFDHRTMLLSNLSLPSCLAFKLYCCVSYITVENHYPLVARFTVRLDKLTFVARDRTRPCHLSMFHRHCRQCVKWNSCERSYWHEPLQRCVNRTRREFNRRQTERSNPVPMRIFLLSQARMNNDECTCYVRVKIRYLSTFYFSTRPA